MARPTISTAINSGIQGWDAAINDNFTVLAAGPWPVYQKTVGDESNLATAFPPGSYDRCILFVNHSTLGWIPYYSDGSAWIIIPRRAAAQADSVAVTVAQLVVDFNQLLANRRASGQQA